MQWLVGRQTEASPLLTRPGGNGQPPASYQDLQPAVEDGKPLEGGFPEGVSGSDKIVKADAWMVSKSNLGVKTIATFGSVALTVNNISGPGMLEFPAIFQSAGWVPCLTVLVVVCFISSACATFLCDTMARIPGNSQFERRIEFSDIFGHFIGPRAFSLTQVVFFLCLLSQNVAAIVSSAQVVDSFVAVFLLSNTYAVDLSGEPAVVSWNEESCDTAEEESGSCEPFSSASQVITLGYITCVVLLFPFGLLNLDENITAQNISFVCLVLVALEFVACFFYAGLEVDRVPAFGPVWHDCLGVVIFNFAFCVTVPSWINEKVADVSVNKVIWGSTVSSTVLYAVVGWLGGMAFADAPDNMLELLESSAVGNTTRVCAAMFGVVIIGLGIPIFCVLMRYNLVVGGVCNNRWATFWGAVFPWLISWLFYTGHGVLELLSWTGLILNGFIDFIFPMVVTMLAAHGERILADGYLQQTVVAALPDRLLPYFDRITTVLTSFIVLLIVAGFILKVKATVE